MKLSKERGDKYEFIDIDIIETFTGYEDSPTSIKVHRSYPERNDERANFNRVD